MTLELRLPNPFPLLIVLSGPSGVGKDAILARMKDRGQPLYVAVTATTRPRRPREVEGADYSFLSEEAFQRMVRENELLEHAQVYGHWYGVPREPVRSALARGLDVVVKVDVQGAAAIRSRVPQALLIFLAPPSLEELEERLRKRHTETGMDLRRRLDTAEKEMAALPLFDYVVVNPSERADWAVAQIDAIIAAEKCRVHPRHIQL